MRHKHTKAPPPPHQNVPKLQTSIFLCNVCLCVCRPRKLYLSMDVVKCVSAVGGIRKRSVISCLPSATDQCHGYFC